MRRKNSKLLLILIIIVLIIILIGGAVFVYLTTDILKSNKNLFLKYATGISASKTGFIDENINQYFEKKKNAPYNNDGTFTMDISGADSSVNNFNISFSGQVDEANSNLNQDISLNYSNSVNFPFSFKKIEDKIGLQTKYVGSKFLAVETDRLNNFLGDSTLDITDATEGIERVKEITNVELTDEDKEHIKNTYLNVLQNELSDDKFSKISENGENGYKLSLSGEELKNLMVKLLETLRDDQITLNKLNDYLKTQRNSSKITTSDIDDAIDELNNSSELDGQTIEITIYTKMKAISRIIIITNDYNLEIKKAINGGNINYQISLEAKKDNETTKITIGANYSGIASMQEINETYEITLETSEPNATYKYTLANNVRFQDNINIEDFTDENSLTLTDYDQEQVSAFLEKVVERIEEVNKEQMEELGLEESENPLVVGIFAPIYSSLQMQSKAMNVIDDSASDMAELEISTFNNKFEVYESTNQSSQAVKGLLSTIGLNNETAERERQIKEINFNGEEYEASEQNIAFIKEDLKEDKTYRVEFEKDEDTGIIYRVVINEK